MTGSALHSSDTAMLEVNYVYEPIFTSNTGYLIIWRFFIDTIALRLGKNEVPALAFWFAWPVVNRLQKILYENIDFYSTKVCQA